MHIYLSAAKAVPALLRPARCEQPPAGPAMSREVASTPIFPGTSMTAFHVCFHEFECFHLSSLILSVSHDFSICSLSSELFLLQAPPGHAAHLARAEADVIAAGLADDDWQESEKWEVLLRGVGTLRYVF